MSVVSSRKDDVVIPEVVSTAESFRSRPFFGEVKQSKFLRVKSFLLLVFVGLSMILMGVMFTLSIIGVIIGIPLIFAGICVLAIAVFVLLSKQSQFIQIRFPR